VLTWKKRCFLILQGSVFTHARWSETFWYAEMRYSFWCKNYRNRSIFAKIVAKNILPRFLCATVYILTLLFFRRTWTAMCRRWSGRYWLEVKPMSWRICWQRVSDWYVDRRWLVGTPPGGAHHSRCLTWAIHSWPASTYVQSSVYSIFYVFCLSSE